MNTSGETSAQIGIVIVRLIVVNIHAIGVEMTNIHELAVGGAPIVYYIFPSMSPATSFIFMKVVLVFDTLQCARSVV